MRRYVDPEDRAKDQSNIFKVEIIAFIVLIISLALALPILVKSINLKKNLKDRKETVVDRIIKRLISDTTKVALPTRFIVPERYLLPPTDQASRGICWAFATIFLLESQYRANGIEKGFLQPNEYVNFSKQAYAKYLLDKCIENPDVSPCKHGGFGLDPRQTDDHKIDSIIYFLRNFTELANSVLPEEVCPYKETADGQDICDGMDEALKTNPIEFKIKSFQAENNIPMAKRLLISKQRPLGLGTPIPDYLFFAPCGNSSYSTHDACSEAKRVQCPEGYESEYCARIMVDSRIRDGTFVYLNDFSRIVYAGGHAVNIVGYNDDWVYKSRIVSEKSMTELRGGFIIHNSWRAPGHSVEYLMGRRSEENEAVICPNHLNPMNWIPATEKCIVDNKGDVTQCGKEYKFVRGHGITQNTDLLHCIDTSGQYCDQNRNYVLGQLPNRNDVDAQPLFNGLDKVKLISWPKDQEATSENIEVKYVDYYPFWAMKLMLEPVNVVENDPLQCGYWMYPYETTTLVNKKTWSLIDTFHVTDIEFEFSDSSYLANKVSGKDYTLLEKSTHNFTRTEFDGPLPYQYVY